MQADKRREGELRGQATHMSRYSLATKRARCTLWPSSHVPTITSSFASAVSGFLISKHTSGRAREA